MTFETIGNRIMIKLDEVADKTESGLYMPQSRTDSPFKWGTVVTAGGRYATPAGWNEPQTKVGDKVLVDAVGGCMVVVGGRDYVVIRNEDVLGYDSNA